MADAADRIGPVADDDRQPFARRGAQAIGHGVDEGVDARADVLNVDHQHVDQVEHLRRRLARLAVEREDRHLAPRSSAWGVSIMLSWRSERKPCWGPKIAASFQSRRGGEAVDDMAKAVVDRGGIGKHADPQAVEARRGDQAFGPEQHGSRATKLAGEGRFGARDEAAGIQALLPASRCFGIASRRRGV